MVSWRKSTYSDGNGGSCVEVAGTARVVLVRDTKDRDGGTLAFGATAWRAFAEQLKRRLAPGRVQHPRCTQFPSHAPTPRTQGGKILSGGRRRTALEVVSCLDREAACWGIGTTR